MNDDMNDGLITAIRDAGEVPPPPNRDAAFARAMAAVSMPGRRWRRGLTLLAAAALLALPAGVFQAVGQLGEPGDPVVTVPDVGVEQTGGVPTGGAEAREDAPNGKAKGHTDPQPDHGSDDERGHKSSVNPSLKPDTELPEQASNRPSPLPSPSKKKS